MWYLLKVAVGTAVNPEIIRFSASASHSPSAFLGDKIKIDHSERSRALPAL
jgi:hypothetical protein